MFQADTQGIASFGVYGVTAQLQDLAGNVISADQTLLPFWPGSRAAALASPLKISWLWPLIGQPQQKVCTATLASNDLAAIWARAAACPPCSTPGRAIPAPS